MTSPWRSTSTPAACPVTPWPASTSGRCSGRPPARPSSCSPNTSTRPSSPRSHWPPATIFLGLGNDPAGTDLWGWATTAGGLQAGGASYHLASGTWLDAVDENLAFRLSVPAPGSLALLAIGAVGLIRSRRRTQ
ncbi:PEP-CTERM sorting domain-containing protein [uncultured Lamprocystis sp.]